eukprot:m.227160 g.227160  ORF g.227160 m.227160 type:complete len:996 (-) comp17319_c0_seq3:2885-5872(-)
MKFNERELALYSASIRERDRIDREGYLWKRGEKAREGYKQRWFVLKGNLLFYFKDTISVEPLGCIVLEKVSVPEFQDEQVAHGFKLDFDGSGNRVYHLYAQTAEDRKAWVEALRLAGFENLRREFDELCQELADLTGTGVGASQSLSWAHNVSQHHVSSSMARKSVKGSRFKDAANKVSDRWRSVTSAAIKSQCLELDVSCQGLPLIRGPRGKSSLPSISIVLERKDNADWVAVASTESQRDSCSPQFSTIIPIYFELWPDDTLLRFVAYNTVHLRQSMADPELLTEQEKQRTRLDHVAAYTLTLKQLLEDRTASESFSLNYPLMDEDGVEAGRLKVQTAISEKAHEHVAPTQQVGQELPFRTLAPARSHEVTPEENEYAFVFKTNGHLKLRVTEKMSEARFAFTIPFQLCQLLIEAENAEMRQLEALSNLVGPVQSAQRTAQRESMHRKQFYQSQQAFLDSISDDTHFKRSAFKKKAEWGMVTTNLHIQRTTAHVEKDGVIEERGEYSVLTLGCPAAHCLSFKHRGLSCMVRERKRVLSTLPLDVDEAKDQVNALYNAIEEATAAFRSYRGGKKTEMSQLADAVCHANHAFLAYLNNQDMAAMFTQAKSSLPLRSDGLDVTEDFKSGLTVVDGQFLKAVRDDKQDLARLNQFLQALEFSAETTYLHAQECLKICYLQALVNQLGELPDVTHRRDMVFSQAVTALVTVLCEQIKLHYKDPSFWQQLRALGFMFNLNSYLSTSGDEEHMIEDMIVGLEDLGTVRIKFSVVDSVGFDPMITGERNKYVIDMGMHAVYYNAMPKELKDGEHCKVFSVLFSQGVNEMQTIANHIGDTSIQNTINLKGYEALTHYFHCYKKWISAHYAERLDEVLELERRWIQPLHHEVVASKPKNIEMLFYVERICYLLRAGRLICCKSGKDRTSMAVTLEMVNHLKYEHDLFDIQFSSVLSILREKGTRRDNVKKNILDSRYAFNLIQVKALPKLLRPPEGTYGANKA